MRTRLKRETRTVSSRVKSSGAAGKGRKAACSVAQRSLRVRLRARTSSMRKRSYAGRSAKSRLPRTRRAWSTACLKR